MVLILYFIKKYLKKKSNLINSLFYNTFEKSILVKLFLLKFIFLYFLYLIYSILHLY
jgi:hypothetical protein